MDSASGPPSQIPPTRRKRWFVLIVAVVGILLIGVAWTKFTLKDDPNVTSAERQQLANRVNDLQTISLGLIWPIDSRLVEYRLDRNGQRFTAYAIEYYTVFGRRMRRVELECWDARPGIDGVATGAGVPIGTLTGTIWCDGIEA